MENDERKGRKVDEKIAKEKGGKGNELETETRDVTKTSMYERESEKI